MSEDELKPCPFCGAKAKTMEWDWAGDCSRHPNISFGAGCSAIGCIAEVGVDSCWHNTLLIAIEAWNKRYNE